MPIRVTVNRQLGIIEVHAYGLLLRNEMEEANAEILRIHQEEGTDKVLGDATKVEEGPRTIDSYEVWGQFPRGIRHAIVLRKADPTGSDGSFIEDVGVNRGYVVAVFETREDALVWLLGDGSAKSNIEP